jgi:hypothetical protein
MNQHLEVGYCPHCQTFQTAPAPSVHKLARILIPAVAAKNPVLAVVILAVGFRYGEEIERWFVSRCPDCTALLQIASVLA